MPYKPSQKIINRYAKVLVNFALGGGRGIRKGEVVYVVAYEYSKPLFVEILRAITKAGGHAISSYQPDEDHNFNVRRDFYVNAKEHQINFFPSSYFRGLVDQIDHYIFIQSETDMEALKGIDSQKIVKRGQSMKPYREWREEKESRGRFTWVISLYGTAAMAREAGLSEAEYWREISNACFLNSSNPITKWKSVAKKLHHFKQRLNNLPIEKLHVNGPDMELWLKIGRDRIWNAGTGRNIPSFEVFTSPDWRGTEGWARFNQPVYTHGHLITGIELRFEGGVIVEARAKRNQKLLKHMVSAPGGNKLGEFSLTDRRLSRITKFMAETLYDENIGGPNGNTHVAIGSSFRDCYRGNQAKVKKSELKRLGFNDSAIHQDMVSTAPRTVTAYLKGNRTRVIYKDGKFVV